MTIILTVSNSYGEEKKRVITLKKLKTFFVTLCLCLLFIPTTVEAKEVEVKKEQKDVTSEFFTVILEVGEHECIGPGDTFSETFKIKNTAKKETKDTTVAVECMTGYTYTYGDKEIVYGITYKADGIHMTPGSDHYAYVYNWDGNLFLEQLLDENGEAVSKTEFSYDGDGNLTDKLYTSHTNGTTTRKTYDYGRFGRITDFCYYNESGKLETAYTYTYDERGYLTECLVTDAEGAPVWKYGYNCDEQGKVIGGQRYAMAESLGQTGHQSDLVYTYDDAGRLLALEWKPVFDNNRLRESKYYTYDEAGRMVSSKIVHQETSVAEDKTYTYDAKGRLISVVDGKGATRTFTYGITDVDSKLAEDAQRWSSTGVIKAYTPAVTPVILG